MFQLFVTDVDLLNLTVLREVLRISVDYHLVDFESKRIHFTWLVSEHGSSRHRQVPKQQMVHINMYNFYVSVKISISVKIKNKTNTDIIQVPIDMMLGREAKSSKQKYRLRTVPLLKLLLTQTFELNGDICPSEGTSKCLWKVALNGKCISVKGNFEIHAYDWLSRSLQKMSIVRCHAFTSDIFYIKLTIFQSIFYDICEVPSYLAASPPTCSVLNKLMTEQNCKFCWRHKVSSSHQMMSEDNSAVGTRLSHSTGPGSLWRVKLSSW